MEPSGLSADRERADLDEASALRRVAQLAASGLTPGDILDAVAIEASALMNGTPVTLVRLEEKDQIGVIVAVSSDHAPLGLRYAVEGDSVSARILRSGQPERVDDYATIASRSLAADLGVHAAVGVPVTISGQLWGMIGAVSVDEPLPVGTEQQLTHFAEIASAAIASAQTRDNFQRLADEQAALLRVAQLVAQGTAETELFDAVAIEASGLIGGEGANLVRFDGPQTFTIIATHGGPAPVGLKVEIPEDDDGTAREVIRTHRPARRDNHRTSAAPLFSNRPIGPGSSVSVPVIVEGHLWGLLGCVTEGRRLPTGTEHRLQQFAELVAAAIANSQARAEMQQLADEQSALLRVAELVARGATGPELFDAITTEAAGLINNEATTMVRYEGDRTFTIIATRDGPAPVGTRVVVPADDQGSMSRMLREKRPNRLDDYASEPGPHFTRERYGLGSAVSVPILVDGELWGMLGCLTEGRPLPTGTEDRLHKFAELAGTAIVAAQARTELQELADEQAALRSVAELAAQDVPADQVLAAVAHQASRLTDVDFSTLLRFEPDGSTEITALDGAPPGVMVGMRAPATGDGATQRVWRTGRPARIDNLAAASGQWAQIAHGHGYTTSAAVPILIQGILWGVIVVVGQDKPLPAGIHTQLTSFAELAATAIAAAQSRRQLEQLADEQATLRRVAELVARDADQTEVFTTVAAEASHLLGNLASALLRYDSDDTAVVVAQHNAELPLGLQIPAVPGTPTGEVLRSAAPFRVDPVLGTGVPGPAVDVNVASGVVAVPILVEGRVWGALSGRSVGSPLPAGTEDRLTALAELAAASIANAETRDKLTASRARVVAAADESRRRLQRDVHDSAQQRLVHTIISLKLAQDAITKGGTAAELIDEALENAQRANTELRDVVHGILPAALSQGGLRAGLQSLVDDYALPVELAADIPRLPTDAETTTYFIVAEALTNVVKHAQATAAAVDVSVVEDRLDIDVSDNGIGGADPSKGTGLTGLLDRIEASNGTLTITSTPGSGTTVHATIPLPSDGGSQQQR